MKDAVLYLLVNKPRTTFKIGISNSPHSRIQTIGADIDVAASFEVDIPDGTSRKVEQLLHYLFRADNVPMPQGDGYTEWFAMDALGEVLDFLSAHRHRLGAGKARPLRERPVRSVRSSEARSLEKAAKAQRADERARRAAQRLAAAGEENARRITELKAWFAELEDSGALVGLVRPRPWAAHADGCLILDGPMAEELAERATGISSSWGTLASPGGWMSIFSSATHATNEPVHISVTRIFLSELPVDADHQDWFPGSDEVRQFLNGKAVVLGSPEDHHLHRLHLRRVAKTKRNWERMHEQFF